MEEWPWNCPPPIYPRACAWVRSFQWVGYEPGTRSGLAAILPRYCSQGTEVVTKNGTSVMLSAMATQGSEIYEASRSRVGCTRLRSTCSDEDYRTQTVDNAHPLLFRAREQCCRQASQALSLLKLIGVCPEHNRAESLVPDWLRRIPSFFRTPRFRFRAQWRHENLATRIIETIFVRKLSELRPGSVLLDGDRD